MYGRGSSGAPARARRAAETEREEALTGVGPEAGEVELWERWRRERDVDAQNALAHRYLPYARAIAAKLFARRHDDGIDFDEYRQFAMVGLMEAIERYAPDLGARFTTFATARIRGAILNGLERLTERHQQGGHRRRVAAERLSSLVHEPAALHDPDRLLRELEAIGVGVALGLILEGTGGASGPEPVLPADAYAQLELRQIHAQLWEATRQLEGRERDIVHMHYRDGRRFDEIAEAFGVTKGRISQLHRQALLRLRALIGKAEACDVSY